MKPKILFQPVSPFYINQSFGQNQICISTDGSKKIISCDGHNPPEGYKSLYGSAGHLGVDLRAKHGQEVYAARDGVVYMIDTNPKSGLDVRVESESNGIKFRHIYEHLLGYQPQVGDKVKTGQLLGWADNCFDKDTEVLTDSGWKFFSDLNTIDKVATINPKDSSIEYQRPTKYTRRFEKEMLTFKNKSMTFTASADHNILVRTGWWKQKLALVKFGRLKSRFPLVINANWKGKEQKYFTLPEYAFKRDRWGTITTKEAKPILMDDWLAFLGIFLADGNLGQKQRNRIVIAQSKPEEIEQIRQLLDRLPFNYWSNIREQGNAPLVQFYISNNQLFDYLSSTKSGKDRKVPDFIRDLSSRQIQIFLDWFFLGDGHERFRGSSYEKTYYPGLSKPIADLLQELLIKTGTNGRIVKRQNSYEVKEKFAKNSYFDPEKVTKKLYNDYAYCVSVPNRTLLVRKNGYAIFLGNTGYSSGDHLHFEFQIWNGKKWVSSDPMPYMEDMFAKTFLMKYNTVLYLIEQVAKLADNVAVYLRTNKK